MPEFVQSENEKRISNIKVPSMQMAKLEPINLIINPFDFKIGELPFKYGGLKIERSPFKLPVPGEGLPRVLHYCADQSGCAFWRMIWPGDELLAHNKAVVMTLYQMVTFAPFYQGIDAIQLQRQCTETQVEFIKFLRTISDEMKRLSGKGFRILYNIDDICMPMEEIPEYNVCRDAFIDPKIGERMKDIMTVVDEMCVPAETMRQHYKKHLNYDKISVIPNYIPKSWADRGVTKEQILTNYRNRNKPRIIYAGSGTHFDVANRVNQFDDFGHVVDYIILDITGPKKYEWVFVGGLPMKLRQFVNNGIEFHDWAPITEYPEMIKNLHGHIMIAPLANNTFSRAKANIKLTEAGALRMPCIAQNLPCYNSDGWKWVFDSAPEMFAHIDSIMESEESYINASDVAREYTEQYWLKDHLDEWSLFYTTDYASEKRKENASFVKNNPDQFKSVDM